jgi:hypothetical protein
MRRGAIWALPGIYPSVVLRAGRSNQTKDDGKVRPIWCSPAESAISRVLAHG